MQNTFVPALLLALVNRLLSWFATRPLAGVLGSVLDHRLDAVTMVAQKRDGLLQELLANHPEIVRMAFAGSAAWTLLFLPLLWLVLYYWVSASGSSRQANIWSEHEWWRPIAAGALGLLFHLVPMAFLALAAFTGQRLVAGRDFAHLLFYAAIAGLFACHGWFAITTLVAHWFGYLACSPAVGLGVAFRAALKFCWRHQRKTWLLVELLLVTFVATYVVSWWLLERLPLTTLGQTVATLGVFGTTLVRYLALCFCYRAAAQSIAGQHPSAVRLRELALKA